MTLTGAAALARGGQEVDEGEKQETDRHMVAMWKVVKKHRPSVPLLELVLNPHDDPCIGFGQTVENMFGLSFLVSLHPPLRRSRVHARMLSTMTVFNQAKCHAPNLCVDVP